MAQSDKGVSGSIPAFHDRCNGPMLFVPCAADLAARVERFAPLNMFETAAGTGSGHWHHDAATGPNQAMIDTAAGRMTSKRSTWLACAT